MVFVPFIESCGLLSFYRSSVNQVPPPGCQVAQAIFCKKEVAQGGHGRPGDNDPSAGSCLSDGTDKDLNLLVRIRLGVLAPHNLHYPIAMLQTGTDAGPCGDKSEEG